MLHTITRQHRTFHKGTWQPTSCATTITNPVGQQPNPTHCHHGTRGGKQEQNLHTDGHSSPSKPSAGGRASGRQSRRVLAESETEGLVGTLEIIRPSPETFTQLPPPTA